MLYTNILYPWSSRHLMYSADYDFTVSLKAVLYKTCTNTLGKGMNPIILPPAMGK